MEPHTGLDPGPGVGRMRRIYVVPREKFGQSSGPLYFQWRAAQHTPRLDYSMQAKYGHWLTAWCLVRADLRPEHHTWLVGQPGVLAFPADLDTQPTTAQRTSLRTALEARGVPAAWLGSGHSWRDVLRAVHAYLRVMKRLDHARNDGLAMRELEFDAKLRDVPATFRQALLDAVDRTGYDRGSLDLEATYRDLMEEVHRQRRAFLW